MKSPAKPVWGATYRLLNDFSGYTMGKRDEYFMENHSDKKDRPDIRDFFMNLSGPMPLGKKISLLFRNNAVKIIKRQDCCGHPGEPGC